MFDNLTDKPVLFWSGGLDSTLLLILLIESGKSFDIVQFRESWTKKQQKRIDECIKKWQLKVFSYPPMGIQFVGKDKDVSVIFEYATAGGSIPLIRDAIEGNICAAELTAKRMPICPMDWDMGIVGTRRDDVHPLIGQLAASQEFFSGMKFIAPLWEWTREEVVEQLKMRGIDTDIAEDEDTGNISLCLNCLNGTGMVKCPKEGTIQAISWNREENLFLFKQSLLQM